MGRHTFSHASYSDTVDRLVPDISHVTRKAEQHAKNTGKLNPLVDPAGYGVIRPSRPRFEQLENKLWEMLFGTPMPIESRLDTTGSMGGNVNVALRVLPHTYDNCQSVLPGYDIQICTGIFGDVSDQFVICRPQFEMHAEKIVEQLTLMVPERDGGDSAEDPQYGLFGAAYLSNFYIVKIGLKGYDFTMSDACARDAVDPGQLKRIFGNEVFEKVAENGHKLDAKDLPSTKEIVQDLLTRSHAFFLQVENERSTTQFWTRIFGRERVVILPDMELAPQVQAVIIGLTEGTLSMSDVKDFLKKTNVRKDDAESILRSVANIPIGAQAALPNFSKRPQKGDLFQEKTDVWPIPLNEVEKKKKEKGKKTTGAEWL